MARIFILEDNEGRNDLFKKKLMEKHELHFFTNVTEAKEGYSSAFNTFFLDHDLGEGEENTGYEFAKFLANKEEMKRKKIIIHSMNPTGAENMKKVLPHAQVVPFIELTKRI